MIRVQWGRLVGFLQARKVSYQMTFGPTNPSGRAVLADLARFCRANSSCFDPDPRVHAVLEGRREVWLRIVQHLTLPAQELAELIKLGNMPTTEDD